MVLFVLRKLILQMGMCSHPVGLDVWFLVGLFFYYHTFMCANSEGSGETAQMRRLARALPGRLCDKYHNLMSCLKCKLCINCLHFLGCKTIWLFNSIILHPYVLHEIFLKIQFVFIGIITMADAKYCDKVGNLRIFFCNFHNNYTFVTLQIKAPVESKDKIISITCYNLTWNTAGMFDKTLVWDST